MHLISNERALAHWRVLSQLPPAPSEMLAVRFLEEQPALAGVLLSLSGGTETGSDGALNVRADDDPGRVAADHLVDLAALAAEILRREAGRPLLRLTQEEVTGLIDDNVTLMERILAAEGAGRQAPQNVFTTCAQRHLFTGLSVALVEELTDEPRLMVQHNYLLRAAVEGLHLACGGEAAPGASDWDAERILVALSGHGDPMRRAALAACEAFRAELTPRFIEELDSWVESPQAALAGDGSLGIHALHLLARWREAAAWPVARRLFSLPGETTHDLLGDIVTEDGSILLAMLAGGRRGELQEMIEDTSLNEYVRGACLDALTCNVAWGEWPRAELLAYIRALLTGRLREQPENEHVLGCVVSAVCDLEAWELRPEVEAVFTRGSVDEGFIDLKFFREVQEGKYPGQWEHFCERHARIEDVAAETQWLDNPPPPPKPSGLETPPPGFDENGYDAPRPYIAPPKVGRNDPCPCGSGRKFKKCCGQ